MSEWDDLIADFSQETAAANKQKADDAQKDIDLILARKKKAGTETVSQAELDSGS